MLANRRAIIAYSDGRSKVQGVYVYVCVSCAVVEYSHDFLSSFKLEFSQLSERSRDDLGCSKVVPTGCRVGTGRGIAV